MAVSKASFINTCILMVPNFLQSSLSSSSSSSFFFSPHWAPVVFRLFGKKGGEGAQASLKPSEKSSSSSNKRNKDLGKQTTLHNFPQIRTKLLVYIWEIARNRKDRCPAVTLGCCWHTHPQMDLPPRLSVASPAGSKKDVGSTHTHTKKGVLRNVTLLPHSRKKMPKKWPMFAGSIGTSTFSPKYRMSHKKPWPTFGPCLWSALWECTVQYSMLHETKFKKSFWSLNSSLILCAPLPQKSSLNFDDNGGPRPPFSCPSLSVMATSGEREKKKWGWGGE